MQEKETMQADCHEDNDKGRDESPAEKEDAQCHSFHFRDVEHLKASMVTFPVDKSRATEIIFPDPTPQWVRDEFTKVSVRLMDALEKDSIRCLFHLLLSERGMSWKRMITPQTFNVMVFLNALRCAKVVLESKTPVLKGYQANPNCMNPYGYFPLHEAAERFNVDMIKLLFSHAASANVRTSNDADNGELLPLHVAVENTCMHKYLEDNILPNQDPRDYIYRLIHLLCLPEMKIFMDTTRLLAKKTNNLVDELWNYMKDGKLIETAVLLLAAQEQIRGGNSSKKNGNGKRDGFAILSTRIIEHSALLRLGVDKNGKEWKQIVEKRTLTECTGLLLVIISQAGEALDAFIQTHSEMPHEEVLERVSSILMDHGFFPTGEGIDVRNLRPYDCKKYVKYLGDGGDARATKVATEMTHLHAAEGKAARKKLPIGWDPTYIKRSFIPYWRSVLSRRFFVKVYPPYAPAESRTVFHHAKPRNSWSNPGLLGRIQQLKSNHQSRRVFGTAAFALLKVLKNA